MQKVQRLNRVTGRFADDIQFALERIGHHDVLTAADKDLANHRLFFTHGRRHRHLDIYRHIAPSEHNLAFGVDCAFDFLFASDARGIFFWQEHHTDTVFAGRRQGYALLRHLCAVILIRNLNQNASTITHQGIGTNGAPMIEVFQNQ